MPRLRPRAVLTAQDLPRTVAAVPGADEGIAMADDAGTAAATTSSDPGAANYLGRLITYIPAEVIAVYQTIQGFIGPAEAGAAAPAEGAASDDPLLLGVGLILAVLTPIWMRFSTASQGEPAAWHQIANATLAFLIWLLMVSNPIVGWIDGWRPVYGSAAMVLAVLIVFPLVEMIAKQRTQSTNAASPQ